MGTTPTTEKGKIILIKFKSTAHSFLSLTVLSIIYLLTGIQRHIKPTAKVYITCLLGIQLLCKIYILWKKIENIYKILEDRCAQITTQSSK